MNLGNLIINLAVNLSALQTGLNQASQALNQFGKKAGEDMKKVGEAMSLYVTAPLALMGAASAKAAIDFESAFAGVRKTVDATEAQYAELERGIRSMAKTIPATANEIATVAEAAGQLGIHRENIMGFSRVMIDLGESTNLASEEAATSLARLANITQMPQSQFDRLGSTVVALGNTLATTEAEIVEMGLRLAGAGKQVGMTEAQILGFAGALSSVGIAAEAGGTAFSRVFKDIYSAVATGNKSLATFAQVAGVTTAQFKQQFEQDAAGAIIAFIEGLGKIGSAGGNTIAILEKLNLSDIRVSDSLLRASGAGDLFRQSIEKGTSAWQENTALTKEAEERYKTMASRLAITRNYLTEIAIIFGRDLMPMIQSMAAGVRDLSQGFAALDPGVRQAIIVTAALAAAIGPLLVALGMFLSAIAPGGTIAVALSGLTTAFGALAGAITLLTGPVGIATVAITALSGAAFLWWKRNQDAARAVRDQAGDVVELAGRYDELSRITKRTSEQEAERKEILTKLEKLNPALISGYDSQGVAIGLNKVALEKYNSELREKLRLEEEDARKTKDAERTKAAAAKTALYQATTRLSEALKERAEIEAQIPKLASKGAINATMQARTQVKDLDTEITKLRASIPGLREEAESLTSAFLAKYAKPKEAAPTTTPTPTTGDDFTLTASEEFNTLKGIQLAQARHSAKMITDAQYLNALRAEAARLERLGVTTSQEYLSVRAAIAGMAPDALSEASKALQLELERVKLFKTGKAGEIKALQAHLASLKKISGTELEQLQTQNRIVSLQETKVDLAAKLKREHEEDLLISAKAQDINAKEGDKLKERLRIQEDYLEKVRKAAEERRDDLKLQDELLRAEKDLLAIKKQQADEAARAAKETAEANKKAFETIRAFAQGFAGAIDTSKVDDLVAKLAAQQEFIQRLEALGAPAEDVERAREDAGQTERDLNRAQADQAGKMPAFVAENFDAIINLPNLIGPALQHLATALPAMADASSGIMSFLGGVWPAILGAFGQLSALFSGGLMAGLQTLAAGIIPAISAGLSSLAAAIVPILPIVAAVVAVFALLQQIWAQNAGGIQEAVGNLMTSLQGIWDGVVAVVQPFVGFVGEVLSYSVNQLAGVFSILGGILKGIGWIFDKVLRPPLDWVAQAFRWVNDAIADFINWLAEKLPWLGIHKMQKGGDKAAEAKQEAASSLEFPQSSTAKMATQIGTAVGKAVSDVMGSFTSINPLPVEDMAKANVFGIGPSSRFFYEKEARVSIDLNVTGEADPASIARAFESSGLRALLADTVGGEVSIRSLNPGFGY